MTTSKLPYGVPDKHMLKSQGADTDIMKFYCTQTASTYGARWSKFVPRVGRPTGSGYVSNVRPVIQYNSKLDEIDNPPMGRIVGDNYHTITERSFRPYTGPSGKEALPNMTYQQALTGFTEGKQLHTPLEAEVRANCIGARVASAPVDIMPRYKPQLHKIQRKDPVEMENGGYGPGCYTTEMSERFRGEPGGCQANINRMNVGKTEESGFTHNQGVDPVTFKSDYAYQGDAPGRETLPKIANRSDHDSGYTHGTVPKSEYAPPFLYKNLHHGYNKAGDVPPLTAEQMKKRDPMEYMNMTHPNNHSSVAANTWLGKQLDDPTDADRLHATAVGPKENTGFTSNNPRHVAGCTEDYPGRFVTDYMARFVDRTPVGRDREGHVWGGVQVPRDDGYTKNNRAGTVNRSINTSTLLNTLEPYVARSIKARDTFFDDHTYDSKIRSEAIAY